MSATVYIPVNNQLKKVEIETESPESSATLRKIAETVSVDYFLLKIKSGEVHFQEELVLEWMDEVRFDEKVFSYSNYEQVSGEKIQEIPTIKYTIGSIRDDFNFGALVVIQTAVLKDYLQWETENYEYAGWYAFRLFASRKGRLNHFDHANYQYTEIDLRKSGEKQFDYVNPNNRARQIEMEKAVTVHLEIIGAKVSPPFKAVNFNETYFETEATVVIPVLNREKTIYDAIHSVLKQKTSFRFNLIIVNNHSTDKTAEIIDSIDDDRIVHVISEAFNLGIGGCWNEAVNHPTCGRFAVQLDSDDLYSDENTLQIIVDKFHEEKCAMVIGSYKMVNFKLEEIPPGVIDHREWSDENGPNNALRINGLGAPRAFYTPIIRKIGFPNVSYGEDYAVGLAISRTWKVGRIYEPVYLCRRWDQNTDSNLSIEKMNAHNGYKDSLRSNEILLRQKINAQTHAGT